MRVIEPGESWRHEWEGIIDIFPMKGDREREREKKKKRE